MSLLHSASWWAYNVAGIVRIARLGEPADHQSTRGHGSESRAAHQLKTLSHLSPIL